MNFEFEKEHERNFVGQEAELSWLDEHLLRRRPSFSPILINGPAGIGKTALVKQWFSTRRISNNPLWLDASLYIDENALDNLLIQIRESREEYRYREGIFIVIDGTDHWTQKQHEDAAGRIFNYKLVSSLIFIRREPIKLSRSQQLLISPLTSSASEDLLKRLLSIDLTEEEVNKVIDLANGSPLILSIIGKLISGKNVESVLSLNSSPLYELTNRIPIPEKEIVTVTRPVIVTINNDLVYRLKRQPLDLHKLTPREFEILLADLLSDMGWEVKLTQQTRDGGADILAYMNTDIGRLLCLVEAKHYREDRKVGVDLVRTLYGTLCDAQANSAMLVTSSSFTPDAKVFQKKHEYQLKLHDYANIVDWILKFGNSKNNFA